MLEEFGEPLGVVLWQILSDGLLWCDTPPEQRNDLFRPYGGSQDGQFALAAQSIPELADAVGRFRGLCAAPHLADAAELAASSGEVLVWAEARGMKETAASFADLAARFQPESPERSYTAGRLSRRLGDPPRAAIWYVRAARLARRAKDEVTFANAHLGLGGLEHDLGNLAAAEKHLLKASRRALRRGRQSLAAAAYHNMVGVAYDSGRTDEALDYLGLAAEFYRTGHPRLPILAYDAGFFLMREGFFSSALLIFDKVLPLVQGQRENLLVRSAIARAAAAVRDHIRFERTAAQVLALVAEDEEGSANALYQLAEGARSFQDWERASNLAQRALDLTEKRKDGTTAALAAALIDAVQRREPGDVDLVPPEEHVIERVTRRILSKLRNRPGGQTGATPPEQYPVF